ncbi:MAG TPA: NFACT family protein [Trueperaceae bacterium]
MEGLLLAEQLRRLSGLLPAERLPWAFPDETTAVLPLRSGPCLWLVAPPRDPRLELRDDGPPRGGPRTPFQRQLAARAAGDLRSAEQRALDRVVTLRFGPSRGFVPEPPVDLVAELTGRNANLVLVGEDGLVLGAMRPVTAEVNRYREVRQGVPYVPPPPYDKLDPRAADAAELRRRLRGVELRRVRDVVDGVGPRLQAALQGRLAELAGASPTDVLEGDLLAAAVDALGEMVASPAAFLAGHGAGGRGRPADAVDEPTRLRRRAAALLADRLALARRRLADAERALADPEEPRRLRAEADLLLAASASWRLEGSRATVVGYDGAPVVLEVDPRRDAAGNARLRYDRARRREARAERARRELPASRDEVARLEAEAAALADAGVEELRRLVAAAEATGRRGAPRPGRGAAEVGARFLAPHGFEVVVGRNARENDAVTFGIARSLDLWLHAQGYRGAHVVVRSAGREVPFDTVLFAARLAAGFSEARGSSNVPVDYTLRKHVWRPKGAAPGAVQYTRQKTVYVEPARDEASAAGHGG